MMKRIISILLAVAAILTTAAVAMLPASAASSFPSLSTSAYCEYKVYGSSIPLYMNQACTTRGSSRRSYSYSATADPGDVCKLVAYYSSTDSFRISYPASGSYYSAYVRRSTLGLTTPTEVSTARGQVTTYYGPTTGTYYGYTESGDRTYKVGTSGSFTRILYQAKSGSRAYKCAYCLTSAYNSTIRPVTPEPTTSPTPPAPITTSYYAKVITSAGLNMRSGAGSNYKKLTAIPCNTVVKITAESGGWGKCTYNGRTGWITLQYTERTGSSTTPEIITVGGSKYYTWKQYQEPWGSKYIKTVTMAQKGCLVTSVAMLICHAGVRSDSGFNPGTFLSAMKSVNGFGGSNGNDMVWASVGKAVPGFNYQYSVGLSGTQQSKINTIRQYAAKGYYIVVCVKNGGHYVAVRSASASSITMMDPNSNGTNLFGTYSASGVTKIFLFAR